MFFFVLSLVTIFANTSCDSTNLFYSFADTSSDKALLEAARVATDQEDYAKAINLIDKMEGDSNEKRILLASALLGRAGIGVLSIANSAISTLSDDFSGSDSFFDSLDESVIFGTGEIREDRLEALDEAINVIATAPNSADAGMQNLGCILSGLLALPSVTTALSAMTAATDNLSQISSNVVGAGATADQCPGITEFEENLTTINSVRQSFSTILATINECPILNISGTSSLNTIETALNKLTSSADNGCQAVLDCSSDTTGLCETLGLGCLSSLISDISAIAGDGNIETCEIIQNCLNPTDCF